MRLDLRRLVPRLTWVVDDETETVSIEATAEGHLLRIGPRFCRKFVRTAADARLVLAHELLHVLRGHLALSRERHPGLARLQNIAMDVLVNAAALTWFLRGEQPGLFRRLYPPASFPACLLLPPGDLVDLVASKASAELTTPLARLRYAVAETPSLRAELEGIVERHLAHIGVRRADAFAREYARGYLDVPEPAGFWERMKALFVAELGIDPRVDDIPLLGDHRDDGSCEGGRLRREAGGRLGRRLAGRLDAAEAELRQLLPTAPSPAAVARFCRQVADAMDESDAGGTSVAVSRDVTTPLPRPGRRDLPLLAMGRFPALWHPRLPRREPERRRLRIYFDVSGSMLQQAPLLFGLLRSLGQRLELPVWAWSVGEPVPLEADDLHNGRFRTRGGTVFEPVIAHAVERGFERIVVLTDGVFPIEAGVAREAREAGLEITFALAGPHGVGREGRLRGVAAGVFRLGSEDEKQLHGGDLQPSSDKTHGGDGPPFI